MAMEWCLLLLRLLLLVLQTIMFRFIGVLCGRSLLYVLQLLLLSSSLFRHHIFATTEKAQVREVVQRWRCASIVEFWLHWCWHGMPVEVEFLAPTSMRLSCRSTRLWIFRFGVHTTVHFNRSFRIPHRMRIRCKRMLCNFNLNNFWIASKQPQASYSRYEILPFCHTLAHRHTHNWHIFGMLCTHSCRARCSKVII